MTDKTPLEKMNGLMDIMAEQHAIQRKKLQYIVENEIDMEQYARLQLLKDKLLELVKAGGFLGITQDEYVKATSHFDKMAREAASKDLQREKYIVVRLEKPKGKLGRPVLRYKLAEYAHDLPNVIKGE